MNVVTSPQSLNARRAVLDRAAEAVVDRGLNYGAPEDNFFRIAGFWNIYLYDKYNIEARIKPVDAALMLALLKIARLENAPEHFDSYVDLAGYAACAAQAAGASNAADDVGSCVTGLYAGIDIALNAEAAQPSVEHRFMIDDIVRALDGYFPSRGRVNGFVGNFMWVVDADGTHLLTDPRRWELIGRHGFALGETVNMCGSSVGYAPGKVVGFTATGILVDWPFALSKRQERKPADLRHGE